MKYLAGRMDLLVRHERGAALKYLALFAGLFFVFGSVAGSWALGLMEMLERVASHLPH